MSDIVASGDPRAAASRLAQTFRAWAAAASRGPTGFLVTPEQKARYTREGIVTAAAALVDTVRRERPLVHQVRLPQQPPGTALVLSYAHFTLDHEQRREDTVRQRHARAGRLAHHGRG